LNAAMFVDYDRIDLVEHEEEDEGQISQSQSTDIDSHETQSRIKGKEKYSSQMMNLLENFEHMHDQSLEEDIYQTLCNSFLI